MRDPLTPIVRVDRHLDRESSLGVVCLASFGAMLFEVPLYLLYGSFVWSGMFALKILCLVIILAATRIGQ